METNRDLLGLTEFEENLFNFVSGRIVPDTFITDNQDFIDETVFGLYGKYVKAGLSIRDCADLFELFVDSSFTYLGVEKPNDSIKI